MRGTTPPQHTHKWRIALVIAHQNGERHTFSDTSDAPTQLRAIRDAATHCGADIPEDAEVMIYIEPIPQPENAEKPAIVAMLPVNERYGTGHKVLQANGIFRPATLKDHQQTWDMYRHRMIEEGHYTEENADEKTTAARGPRPTEDNPHPDRTPKPTPAPTVDTKPDESPK